MVGFDDIRFRDSSIRRSASAQPMRDIGEASVRLSSDILQGRITTPQSILPHTPIIRSTTAPLGVAAENKRLTGFPLPASGF